MGKEDGIRLRITSEFVRDRTRTLNFRMLSYTSVVICETQM